MNIMNKNAREKALLEEAYGNVYKEEFNPRRDAPSHKSGDPHPATRAAEDIVDREVTWDRYSGVVDEVDVEKGVAWVITDDDGGLHEVELGNFDHIGDKREREDEDNEIESLIAAEDAEDTSKKEILNAIDSAMAQVEGLDKFPDIADALQNVLDYYRHSEDGEDIDKDEDKLVKVDDETEDAKYFSKNTQL